MISKSLNFKTIIAVSLVLAAISFQAAWAHKYYAAMTRMSYNTSTQEMEFTHHVFAHDMEAVLSKISGKKVNFDDIETITPLLIEYMHENFKVVADGAPMVRQWVGFEVEDNILWIYEEVPTTTLPKHLEFTNSMFLGMFRDQVNTLTVTINAFRQSLNFMGSTIVGEMTVE